MTKIIRRSGQRRSLGWLTGIFAMAGFLLSSSASAQVDTGAIQGTVRDSTGGVVLGASVTLINVEMGVSFQTKTNDVGMYQFPSIRIGNYTLVAEASGFAPSTRDGIAISIQQRFVADFALQPSGVLETVHVTADAVQLQTQDASLGGVVSSKTINDLPLNGRNYAFLAQLNPGVIQAVQDSRGLAASGSFSANGQDSTFNNYLLDGVDNNSNIADYSNGSHYVYRPAVDALEEFKVQTSSYSAEFGRAGGGIVNASIKSGTEQFHGSWFEFHRNAALDATNFFTAYQGLKKGEFIRNQFGATLGGPLRLFGAGRKKTFFFIDYEGTLQRQATLYRLNTPTALMQQSNFTDFSELLTQGGTRTDRLGRSFPLGTIMDPATTRAVTGGQIDPVTGLRATGAGAGFVRDPIDPTGHNIIPANRLNSNVVRLLKLFPAPTGPGINQNYNVSPINRDRNHQGDIRIDQYLSDKDTMFGRFSLNRSGHVWPSPYPGIIDGSNFTGSDEKITLHNQAFSWTHVFSSSVVSEMRFGYSGLYQYRQQFNGDDLGIAGRYGIWTPQVPGYGGLPVFNVTGLGRFGAPSYMPTWNRIGTSQFSAVVTKLTGAHSVKFGAQYLHPTAVFFQTSDPRGRFFYSGTYTDVVSTSGGNTGLAQMLLTPLPSLVSSGFDSVGGPDQIWATNIPERDPTTAWSIYSGFIDDSWKTTQRLTLDLGLRYDFIRNSDAPDGYGGTFQYDTAPTYLMAKDRCMVGLSPSFLRLTATDGITIQCADSNNLIRSPRTLFAPRLGVAYKMGATWVARAGAGIFYQTSLGGNIVRQIWQNYPFLYRAVLTNNSPAVPIVYGDGTRGTFESGVAPVHADDPLVFNATQAEFRGQENPLRVPHSIQFNVTVQHQLSATQIVSVGYVGSRNRDGSISYNYNGIKQMLPPGLNQLPYRQFPDFSAVTVSRAGARGEYNSLQTSYDRRSGRGLDTKVNYTYSKCRNQTLARNVWLLGPDWGLCGYDAPHLLSASLSYALPFGRGERFLGNASGFMNQLIGGWRINAIGTYSSGPPITIPCNITTATGSGCNALLTGEPLYPANRSFEHWLNGAAFTNPPVATTIGQSDLSPLGGLPSQARGPDFRKVDASLFKTVSVRGEQRLEFRVEAFNLLNHPNFSVPGYDSGGAGLVPAPGVLDFSNTQNFGRIIDLRGGQNDERQIQIALKYYW
jgi:hypothetical protein